ncbi:MAG: glycosyltransferase family 1 protein, partial [Candidatus Omnitrophica bacterium]|nr:glycosyltransferase family 1 protein [Candidatus Omnitrophota bacterium]
FYKDPGDLKAKIERYLFKKDDRDRIGLAGYEEVMRTHKYTDRLNFMITSVRETP